MVINILVCAGFCAKTKVVVRFTPLCMPVLISYHGLSKFDVLVCVQIASCSRTVSNAQKYPDVAGRPELTPSLGQFVNSNIQAWSGCNEVKVSMNFSTARVNLCGNQSKNKL